MGPIANLLKLSGKPCVSAHGVGAALRMPHAAEKRTHAEEKSPLVEGQEEDVATFFLHTKDIFVPGEDLVQDDSIVRVVRQSVVHHAANPGVQAAGHVDHPEAVPVNAQEFPDHAQGFFVLGSVCRVHAQNLRVDDQVHFVDGPSWAQDEDVSREDVSDARQRPGKPDALDFFSAVLQREKTVDDSFALTLHPASA